MRQVIRIGAIATALLATAAMVTLVVIGDVGLLLAQVALAFVVVSCLHIIIDG